MSGLKRVLITRISRPTRAYSFLELRALTSAKNIFASRSTLHQYESICRPLDGTTQSHGNIFRGTYLTDPLNYLLDFASLELAGCKADAPEHSFLTQISPL
jgi:hypothetical protein